MPETFCKDCKHDGDNVCKFTGIRHDTGITCPSFGAKEGEVEMNFRVRESDDNCDTWVVADGDTCSKSEFYIQSDGVVGKQRDCETYDTKNEAEDALDLYLQNQEPKRTFVGHPEGVLEIKVDSADSCGGSTAIRTFDSGATRDTDQGKLDYEGFLHPVVIERYAEYLNKHRVQSDGKLRDSDNWQKGLPIAEYMKSKFRHFMDTWLWHRSGGGLRAGHKDIDIEDTLCAELFNTMGMLFEVMRSDGAVEEIDHSAPVEGGY